MRFLRVPIVNFAHFAKFRVGSQERSCFTRTPGVVVSSRLAVGIHRAHASSTEMRLRSPSTRARGPLDFRTLRASRKTRSLSAERLMTQFEMTTSTLLSGSGIWSISPLRNSTFSTPALRLFSFASASISSVMIVNNLPDRLACNVNARISGRRFVTQLRGYVLSEERLRAIFPLRSLACAGVKHGCRFA